MFLVCVQATTTTSSHSWRTESEILGQVSKWERVRETHIRRWKKNEEKIIWFDAEVDTWKYAVSLTDRTNERKQRKKKKKKTIENQRKSICILAALGSKIIYIFPMTDWLIRRIRKCTHRARNASHTAALTKNRQINRIQYFRWPNCYF